MTGDHGEECRGCFHFGELKDGTIGCAIASKYEVGPENCTECVPIERRMKEKS